MPLSPRGFQDDDEDIVASPASTLIRLDPDRENLPFRLLNGKDIQDDDKDHLSATKACLF